MTKPRFTPDPLPDGLDPTLASYLQRQFDRIDDWWPKDLEDRVKALEEIASGIGGIWPIVDYSTISFTGEAADAACVITNLSNPTSSITYPSTFGLSLGHLYMKPDGTKIYVCSRTEFNNPEITRGVLEFNLLTPFDVTTIENDGSNLTYTLWNDDGGWSSFSNQAFPLGIAISSDGTKCFLIDAHPNGALDLNPDAIVRYDMSTPWDISTMSHTREQIYYTDGFASNPTGITISDDGKYFYIGNSRANTDYNIYQIKFSTAYDIESSSITSSYNPQSELSLSGVLPVQSWQFLDINNTGTRLVAGNWSDAFLWVFGMSTPHDISTASYLYRLELPGEGANSIYGMYVDTECQFAVFVDPTLRKFWRYEIG